MLDYLVDGVGVAYPDFEKKQIVSLLPDYSQISSFINFDESLAEKIDCMKESESAITMEMSLPDIKEPPVVTLYPKHYEEVGVNNTLVCLVDQFYPPPVTVRWTRNLQQVTEGTQTGRYLPSDDGSFRMFATLDFTPEEGDVYTCSVEHQALDAPLTRTWELEVLPVSRPSVGPAVFCGVGLAVGLVGVAAGAVLFVKGKQRQ